MPRIFGIAKLHAATRCELPQLRPPSLWTAAEEYHRTGVHSSSTPYVANDLQGAMQQLPLFQTDIATATGESKRKGDCTKHQHQCYFFGSQGVRGRQKISCVGLWRSKIIFRPPKSNRRALN
jgi:hypothetical protein